MRVLGLIPARGGSKGIPRKNIVPLAGRPLLAWTCSAALGARALDRVVLSTDDEEIAAVGRACGVEAPFRRPAELASDTASSADVAVHALAWLEAHEGWRADVLVLLQPTSPLRTARHVDEAVAVLEASRADTVVSVVEVPHSHTPYKLMRLDGERLVDFWADPDAAPRDRRQGVPLLYARNGPAVLVTRAALLRERGTFYGERVLPYVMDRISSIDVDDVGDLEIAAALLAARGAGGSGERTA